MRKAFDLVVISWFKVKEFFHYTDSEEAKEQGFTHGGTYWGIPIWLIMDENCPEVCTKWAPMEYLFTVAAYVDYFKFMCFIPDEEPHFAFEVTHVIASAD